MADADFDGFVGDGPRASAAAVQRYVTLAGALASLALLIGFAVWGYRLAVRDVTGVPVIQALDGPMRVVPDDPGGEIADHQGLAVNAVAAEGVAAPPPDRLVLAPRPTDLADEDLPGLAAAPLHEAAVIAAPGDVPPASADPVLAAAPPVESADPTAIAVEAALAEALGLSPDELAAEVGAGGPLAAEAAPAVDLALGDGALAVSPRPRARPARSGTPPAAETLPAPNEVDPATIPVGTRLVQFGAFDTAEAARAEWQRLAGQFGELMASKSLVVQPAESGGRTFFRLRAHGFQNEDDARRFCSAFVAQNATCIPVPQR
jgi:hypothetical protein